MKKRTILFILLSTFFSLYSIAQIKIGVVDANFIMGNVAKANTDKYKTAQENLQVFGKKLEEEYQRKVQELQVSADEFEKGAATMTETARKDTQDKLVKMESDLREFQQKASADLQRKEQEELKPIYDDIEAAIKQIVGEKAYTHIFRKEALLYEQPDDDISIEILKKMGVTPKE